MSCVTSIFSDSPIPLIRWQLGRSTDSTSLEALSRFLFKKEKKNLSVYVSLLCSRKGLKRLTAIQKKKKKPQHHSTNLKRIKEKIETKSRNIK